MNKDARLAVGLPTHPKTIKLKRRLQHAGPLHLIYLWLWAAQNRPDGDLSGMTDEDIEIASGWDGEADSFVKALLAVGWLDGDEGDRRLHDWEDHNPWAAGAQRRSEAGKIAALIKHGMTREDAERKVFGARRMRTASEPQPKPPNPQCPVSVSVSVTDSVSESTAGAAPENPAPPEASADTSGTLIELPAIGGTFHVTHDQAKRWAEIYTGVDVELQLRKMLGWLEANSKLRKTRGGMPRFIVSWLSREQDRPKPGAGNGTHRPAGKQSGAAILDETCADAYAGPQAATVGTAH